LSSLQEDIALKVAPWIEHLSAAVRDNPSGDIYDMLAQSDTARLLEDGLTGAQSLAEDSLDEVWPPDSSAYRAGLAEDIDKAYATAAVSLRQAAIEAFNSVGPAWFVPGVDAPGSDPSAEAAIRRAEEVERVTASAAWQLGSRNEMTVAVAEIRYRGEEVLARAEAGDGHWLKKWVCRKGPDGRQDEKVCAWCRELDAMPAIPVWQEFPSGSSASGRCPPRVYRNLRSPPRHIRCRCHLILVRAEDGFSVPVLVSPADQTLFISAQDVRNMPAGRYHAHRAFHRAALFELGKVIARNRQARRK